jgi:hypothetical protein
MKSNLQLWYRKSPVFFVRETYGNYTEISYNGDIRSTDNSTITKRFGNSGQYSISLPSKYEFFEGTGLRVLS